MSLTRVLPGRRGVVVADDYDNSNDNSRAVHRNELSVRGGGVKRNDVPTRNAPPPQNKFARHSYVEETIFFFITVKVTWKIFGG